MNKRTSDSGIRPRALADKIGKLFRRDKQSFVLEDVLGALMEFFKKYFRLQLEGLHHLPQQGPAIIAPNHSGVSGLDALVLRHAILEATGRTPSILTHPFWFRFLITRYPAKKMGFVKASLGNGVEALDRGDLLLVFPEGEYGNFKPSQKRYQLQTFRNGFVRMAVKKQVPIIPCLIVGAEESHINLAQIELPPILDRLILPVPLNWIPLPTKWKIVFLPPMELPYLPEASFDRNLVTELAQEIRELMQQSLTELVQKRGKVFF